MNTSMTTFFSVLMMIFMISGCNSNNYTLPNENNTTHPTKAGALHLELESAALLEGNSTTATLKLIGSKNIDALEVAVSSTNSAVASLSASSCTLSTENSSCTLTATGVSQGVVSIDASAQGYTTVAAPVGVNIEAGALRIVIDKPHLDAGKSTSGYVLLEGSSGVTNLNVSLASSHTNQATLNISSCMLSSSSNRCNFILNDHNYGTSTITASATDYISAKNSVAVEVPVEHGVLGVSLNSTYIQIGSSTTGTVRLIGGSNVSEFNVSLGSSDTRIATLSTTSCTLSSASSQQSCSFTVNGIAEGLASISAQASGYDAVSVALGVDTTTGTLALSIDSQSLTIDENTTATVTLTGSVGVNDVAVSVTSSDSGIATLSTKECTLSSVSNSCTVTLKALAQGTSTITASASDYTSTQKNILVQTPDYNYQLYTLYPQISALPDTSRFTPIYTQMITGHGAVGDESNYSSTLQTYLQETSSHLNDNGKALLEMTTQIINRTNEYGHGMLTPTGKDELQGTGKRHVESLSNYFDQAITQNRPILFTSSSVIRAIDSGIHYLEGMRQAKPEIAALMSNETQTVDNNLLYFTHLQNSNYSPFVGYANEVGATVTTLKNSAFTQNIKSVDNVLKRIYTASYVESLSTNDKHALWDAVMKTFNLLPALGQVDINSNGVSFESLITPDDTNLSAERDDIGSFYTQSAGVEGNNTAAQLASELLGTFFQNIYSIVEASKKGSLQGHHSAKLYFSHAETVMPFEALLEIPGNLPLNSNIAYSYTTCEFRGENDANFAVNVRWDLFEDNGNYYVQMYKNEKAVPFKASCQPVEVNSTYYAVSELQRCYGYLPNNSALYENNATDPFGNYDANNSWGPYVKGHDRNRSNVFDFQREQVLDVLENIAVLGQWNYCHHHSPIWFPGNEHATQGAYNGTGDNAFISLYCSTESIYSNEVTNFQFNTEDNETNITRAYRWNSTYAKQHVPGYNTIVSQTFEGNDTGMHDLLYMKTTNTDTRFIDESWWRDPNDVAQELNATTYVNPNFSDGDAEGKYYTRQANWQMLNGLDCSDLTHWAYMYALNLEITTNVSNQAGQFDGTASRDLDAQTLCNDNRIFTSSFGNAAGNFVTYDNKVINYADVNSSSAPLIDQLGDIFKPGDLLFIAPGVNGNASAKVTHVIVWTGKKVSAAGNDVNSTNVPLNLIAPGFDYNNQQRRVGEWVIIDSHFQGPDYRTFTGWYPENLWGVRRVIGPNDNPCHDF